MSRQIKQHNAIIEARHEMSALQKNIVYLLLNELGEDDPPETSYFIHLNKLRVKNWKMGKVTYEQLDQATSGLLGTVYTIEEGSGETLIAPLITFARYSDEDKTLVLKISRYMHPYLFQLKKDFTSFGLEMALRLRSVYAKRLYEMLSQFKEVGRMDIAVDELKYRLAIQDLKKGTDKYPFWSEFERRVLKVPQRELAKHTDVQFTYTAEKTQGKVTHLVFHIQYGGGKEKNGFKVIWM